MLTTLIVNPTILVILYFGGGDYRVIVALNVTYQVIFIQISIILYNISLQFANKRRYNSGQWTNSFIIDDMICRVTHKRCHPKSYQSDLKHHMTQNIILSVATLIFSNMGPPTNLLHQVKVPPPKFVHHSFGDRHCRLNNALVDTWKSSGPFARPSTF